MVFSLINLRDTLKAGFWKTLTIRFRKDPIDSADALAEFVQTRSSYVAQTSLYGYLKNRMGISYPEVFADEVMAKSINMAKWRTYGSCLTDLAIFAAALTGENARLEKPDAEKLARHCFDHAVADSFDDADAQELKPEIMATFIHRLTIADWATATEGENAFLNSPVDLVRFAPIADELKAFDKDIVINSTRFRWKDIRNQLKSRIDPEKISADFLDHH